ncbi:MAG: hypothetical protein JJ909_16950 [Roseivirga sp.]|uniref:MutS-related protein n=1 Tax=Roseivirga sp. TaxID=1964215 RepID=UPI001B104B68|nr:hypothetical protein [Roseivirga sp.]MBO6661593.1 hypothetical protein [Roseivirga sp.]MBO6762648.1 hypothetical protein [Roseivirga sp.]MBO6908423.1 hypothetical protein [Roseivirga sp.]
MKETAQETYQKRFDEFKQSAKSLKSDSNTFSTLRVILFIVFTITFVYAANAGNSVLLLSSVVVFLIGYLVLLKKHQSIKRRLKVMNNLSQINSDEILRGQFNLSGFEDGMEFFVPSHPYHMDLDIFGKHSLYQLINRTSSVFGKQILADWLSNHAPKNEILKRQEAIKELTSQLDLRQEFQAQGMAEEKPNKDSIKTLFNWLKEEQSTKNRSVYKVLMALLSVATITSIVLAYFSVVAIGLPILLIFINIGVLSTLFQKLLAITRQTENGYKSLRSLKAQIELIENAEVKSTVLQELKSPLSNGNKKASKLLQELSGILDNLQNRANVLYQLLNAILLLDIFWYLKINKWKEENEANLEEWFEVIGTIDTLMSIAGFAFSNPDYQYSEIADTPHTIRAEELGHPLINSNKRVSNNFDFSGKGGVCLITGSNMSGKSTFLRTVGLNCVLGLMGAPVCAKSMQVGELKVFTSMRTQDDLEESVSSFYAELKRLKQLIGQIDEVRPTLFMIDEVLKGTNSDDRHKGATALIKQLNKTNAFGFVSTHDIVLGNMTNELAGVKNYSFNSTITGNEIHFNYKLTPGLCKSFNATKLMQLMGIEVE